MDLYFLYPRIKNSYSAVLRVAVKPADVREKNSEASRGATKSSPTGLAWTPRRFTRSSKNELSHRLVFLSPEEALRGDPTSLQQEPISADTVKVMLLPQGNNSSRPA